MILNKYLPFFFRKSTSILFYVLLAFGATAQGIDFFHGDWKEAIQQAGEQEKLVFVDAYAKWCGPCKKMAATTFVDPSVGEYMNKHFISMKLDMEESMGRDFGQKYPVSAYPTLFFIDANGEVVKRITGFRDPQGLIDAAKEAFGSADFSAKYAVQYDEGARDYETVYQYVKTLNQAGKPSAKIANDFLNSEHGMTSKQKRDFIYMAVTDADSKMFDMMMSEAKVYEKEFGESQIKSKILDVASTTTNKAIEFEYPDLMTEVSEKIKTYDKSISQQYDLESQLEYAAAYKDWETFEKNYATYKKKYCGENAERCAKLNKLLSQHFIEQPEYQVLTMDNLYQIKDIDPTEQNYIILIQSLFTQQKYQEALDVAMEGKDKLGKTENPPKQIDKIIEMIEKQIKG